MLVTVTRWRGGFQVKHWLCMVMHCFCTGVEARQKSRSCLALPCLSTTFCQKSEFSPRSKTDGNRRQSLPTAAQREPFVQGFGNNSCVSCSAGIRLLCPFPCRSRLQCRGLHPSRYMGTSPQRLHEESLRLDPTQPCLETPQAMGSPGEQGCHRERSGCRVQVPAKKSHSAAQQQATT